MTREEMQLDLLQKRLEDTLVDQRETVRTMWCGVAVVALVGVAMVFFFAIGKWWIGGLDAMVVVVATVRVLVEHRIWMRLHTKECRIVGQIGRLDGRRP